MERKGRSRRGIFVSSCHELECAATKKVTNVSCPGPENWDNTSGSDVFSQTAHVLTQIGCSCVNRLQKSILRTALFSFNLPNLDRF